MSCSNNVIGSLSKVSITGEFEWLINLSDEILETEESLESPTFSFSRWSWYFTLYPKGNNSFNREYISLFLRKKETQSETYVEFSLKMTLKGKDLIKRDTTHIFKESEIDWGWSRFILRKEVLDSWSKETEDCSQLAIKIRMTGNDPLEEDTSLEKRMEGTGILSQNYKDLLLHSEDYDLVIKVKEKEFRAHRIIMQCRCPVFKSMLSHEMLEKSRGVVDIPDCDPSAFEQFLLHVYTGKVEVLDTSNMLNLYIIADKYNMDILKEECTAFIKKSLSVNVFTDVIKFASYYNDASLLKFATCYFISFKKRILVSEEWQSFEKEFPTQANELLMKTYDRPYHSVSRPKDDADATDMVKKMRKFLSKIEKKK